MKKIGLFYGVGTEKTAAIAKQVQQAIGDDLVELVPIETAWQNDFNSYENIIIGTSTWFDGELPTYWDEMIPALEDMNLTGKKVAIFGLGDQVNYPDNFVDGIGILADILKSAGAILIGATSTDGYTFNKSLAVSNNQFIGLVLDIENQSDKTAVRIKDWVTILKNRLNPKEKPVF